MDLKHYLTIAALLFSFLSAEADEWQHYFEEGNKHYQNNDYAKAISEYKKILDYGYESGELYFNLGNAYYKQDELGLARLYYERAGKFLKNDEGLEQNLTMVKLRLVDQIEAPPRLFLEIWWDKLLNIFGLRVFTALVVSLIWLVLIIAAIRLYLIKRHRPDRFKTVFIILFIIMLFFSVLYVQKIYILETEEYGIVMPDKVTLYGEPSSEGTELFILHEGSKVEIIRTAADWYEVRLIDGKTGWLESSSLEII